MLDLSLVKKHLNVYFNDDDELIQHYIDVAEKVVLRHLDESMENLLEKGGGQLPPPVQQGILLLVGDFYQSRESVAFNSSPNELPLSFNYLMDLYKNYLGQ